MKKYLLLLQDDIKTMQRLSPKEMETLVGEHMAWTKKMAASGYLISGDGLEETSIHITGKECIVKDGPYVEAKEMIGGYYLLQAEDIDTVTALAKDCPCHLWGGTTVIRPIMDYEQ